MYRFKTSLIEDGFFQVTGEDLHHLIHVLRLKTGDRIAGFDNSGRQWVGIIDSITKDFAACQVIEENCPDVEAKTKVFLVMGLAKGEKMEWVIQKGTELGMAGFVPLKTQRAVVQLEGKKAEERVRRWQKIAAEAVKQSRRVIEPQIKPVSDWKDLQGMFPPETQWLIPYEDEKTISIGHTLQVFNSKYPIAVLIGPEGGFTFGEVQMAAEQLNAKSVSLGPRILRTETAAITALIRVLSYYGDLG